MGKRLLASFLAAAMMLTMAPFAFAADDEVSTQATNTNVAQIGDKQYTSITSAITKSNVGDTIQLLADVSTDTLKSGVTYDLHGHTLTYTSAMTVENTAAPTSFIDASVSGAERGGTLKMTRTSGGISAFTVSAGATFNAQNIRIESTRCEGIFPQGKGATLNITNCDMKANWYCVGTNAGNLANYGVIINLKGSTFSSVGTLAVDGTAVYINVSGKLNIDDCELTAPRQALMVRAGTANITNSTLKTTGSYSDKEQYYTGNWSSGNEVPAAALVVGNYVNGAAGAYVADAVVTVENTKLIGENDFPALYVDGNTAYKSDVSISGDETVVSGAVMKGQQTAEGAVNIGITGGTFSTDVSAYVASGYEVVQDSNSYTVKAESVAEVGGKKYTSLADAVADAESGATVKLLKDVGLPGYVVIDKSITLDLNGKKLYNTVDIWNESNALVRIKNGADVTITGNGTMSAKENDCYAIAVVKGNLTIENGTFIGNVSAVQVEDGHLAINGGKFDLLQKWEGKSTFLINCIDAAYRDGTAKVSITGGTFVDFNPANNEAEGAGTNFLATGYITTKVGDNYVVKAGTNKNISDLNTAIDTIKNENSSDTEKNTAVDVIKNIDNADLANNSAAMSKLAELDDTLTDSTSGSAKVTVEGKSTATGITSDAVEVTNAALSADLTSTTAQNVVVTIANNDNITNNAVEAAKNAAGITDDVAVQKLNISMTVNGKTVEKPTAPVVLEFPLPEGWKGCQIVCVDDANKPELVPTTVIGNTVKATFNHFSDYAMLSSTKVANPNKYQIVLTPTNNQTTVYPGDKITFNVVLKRTEGNSDIVHRVQFTPTSDMLTVDSATAEAGFTYNATSKQFTHLDASNPVTLTNGEVKVGTINCTVNNNGTLRGNLNVTVGDQDTVTVSGYQNSNGLEVAELSVEYAVIQVYFTNYTGKLDSKGNEVTELKTFYTSANNKNLYASLDDLVAGTPIANAPTANNGSIENGTQYRLTDDTTGNEQNNWVAANGTTKYVDVVADSGAGFTDTMSFYVSRVKLLEVDKSDGVEIDKSIKTTTRDSKTYVDYNKDFTFTVPDAGAGMKNEVTVTVNGTTVTVTPDPDIDNKYTVGNDDMIASPVKITVTPVIDLDADDIGIFDDGLGKFLQYSKYSGEDTLVLIKGNSNVKYTLNPGEGVEAPEIYTLPMGHGYGDYTLAVLIPRPELSTGADARAIMLDYLKNTYHIAVTEGTNTAINAYDFDTNGDGNGTGTFRLDDAQATYDFSALEKAAMYWEPSDVELLKADVLTYDNDKGEHNTPRDGQVTTEDVDAFLYNYVYPGMHP